MRVTAETKAATRQRILEAARHLFETNGFESSTTRELADAAGIATGTLFNYFATKEAVLACLAAEAVAAAHRNFEEEYSKGESLEAQLFAFAAAGLRKLKPLRRHLPVLLETALNPLAAATGDDTQFLRLTHLETVARLAKEHGFGELPPVALQLYWTLYVGVLMFWAQDRSHMQEHTLALLDHSLSMFSDWLKKDNESFGRTRGEEPCPRR
jgi:AcrR family transcriptional regulator